MIWCDGGQSIHTLYILYYMTYNNCGASLKKLLLNTLIFFFNLKPFSFNRKTDHNIMAVNPKKGSYIVAFLTLKFSQVHIYQVLYQVLVLLVRLI